MVNVIQDLFDMIAYFVAVAAAEPFSGVLLLLGLVFVTVPSAIFLGLAAAGIADLVIPE